MKFKENYYNKMSLAIIIIIGILLTLIVTVRPVTRSGETDTYMLPAISVEQRLSLFVNQSDINKAQVDFPDIYQGIKTFNDLRSARLVVVDENKWISWYFPTYSIAALPVKLILKVVGVSQARTFLFTNILFFLLALTVVYTRLKTSDKKLFFTILLLTFNPVLFYIIMWASAESFMFSLIVMSLVFFSNKEYKKAGILVSLAGSLNPTIMIYGAMIIVSYFIDVYNDNKNKEKYSFNILIRKKMFDTLLFGICFIPSIVPFIFNYIVLGKLNPTLAAGSPEGIFERFFAYLFDLNLGFFPFVPVLLIMFFILSVIGLYRKNVQSMVYFISFLGTVFAYSVMSHINCGMTGMARYNAWSLPIMIFFITTVGLAFIKKDFIDKMFTGSIYLSVIITVAVLVDYSRPPRHDFKYHNHIASAVLNNFPQLYNPFYATFISRTEHVDGGYSYTHPVIYTDNRNQIRKIMVTGTTVNELTSIVKGDSKSLEFLKNKIDKIKNRTGYNYINIPFYSDCKLFILNK